MQSKSPLDDPENAAFAWARYRRLLRFMFAVTVAVVGIAMTLIYLRVENLSIHLFIAVGLGITASMMLTGALMGLVFLSNGTGHDASIDDRLEEERTRGD
ncbi:hypothetical protein MKP08_03725 [Erythrobacter sp. LQ02-29]|uniref:hypothetical protein n=1 Tax=unclassified Erythrobacter TaxID=2633097 RepID=UPI001BFC34B5|nr:MULTISPECIES: hypothetical protein [unclassified Erythrobacter]MCP9221856.1 hypothetical protein [Erythrobacter sp. LQ02-29]QWC56785.1 hypothetical protein F7D01_06465 [Erythrobacter sp. 3-20A1M]